MPPTLHSEGLSVSASHSSLQVVGSMAGGPVRLLQPFASLMAALAESLSTEAVLDSKAQPDHPPLHCLDFSPGVGSSLAATLSFPLTPSEPLRSHVDLSTPHLRRTRPPSPGPCCSMASCPVGRTIPGNRFPGLCYISRTLSCTLVVFLPWSGVGRPASPLPSG